MKKEAERKLARKIVRGVAKEFRSRGFVHTKPTFLVRPFYGFSQFVHFHKFSGSPRFRVHFGVRVMNDPFAAIALNGPSIEHAGSYDANEEESFACTQKLSALIENEGLSWFSTHATVDELLQLQASPLQDRDRAALLDDLNGRKNKKSYQRSERLLGLINEKG